MRHFLPKLNFKLNFNLRATSIVPCIPQSASYLTSCQEGRLTILNTLYSASKLLAAQLSHCSHHSTPAPGLLTALHLVLHLLPNLVAHSSGVLGHMNELSRVPLRALICPQCTGTHRRAHKHSTDCLPWGGSHFTGFTAK